MISKKKNIISFLHNIPVRLLILSLILGIAAFTPLFAYTYPNIDTITDVFNAGKTIPDIAIFFDFTGRYRASWTLFATVLNAIFSYHIRWYFLLYGVALGVTLWTMFMLVYQKNKRVQHELLIIPVLMLLNNITVATYWRLGACESIFTLILIWSVLCIQQKRYTLCILSLLSLIPLKEISIIVLLITSVYMFVIKKYRYALILFISSAMYGLFIKHFIAESLTEATTPYFLTFTFTSTRLIEMFHTWGFKIPFVFILSGINTLLLIIHQIEFKRVANIPLYLLILSVGLLSPYLFLAYTEEYYLFPSYTCSILCFTYLSTTTLQRKKHIQLGILVGSCILFFYSQSHKAFIQQASLMHQAYIQHTKLIERMFQYPYYFYQRQYNKTVTEDAFTSWVNTQNGTNQDNTSLRAIVHESPTQSEYNGAMWYGPDNAWGIEYITNN